MGVYDHENNDDLNNFVSIMDEWANDLGESSISDVLRVEQDPAIVFGFLSTDDINHYDPVVLKEKIDSRVAQSERIKDSDIDEINRTIQDYYQGINYVWSNDEIQAESLYDKLEYCTAMREQNQIDLDTTEIPFYVESLIGTTDTPAMIQEQIDTIRSVSSKQYGSHLNDLYDVVYSLQTYDFSDVSSAVTGRRSDYSKVVPSLITRDTLDMLGPDYQTHCDQMFKMRLSKLGEKYDVADISVNHEVLVSGSSRDTKRVSYALPAGMDNMLDVDPMGPNDDSFDF